MTDINNVFGFELYQKLYHNDIQKKEDVIILFVHWFLIKSGFRCIGTGDEIVFDPSEKGSELLPTEWNSRPNYAVRYIKDGKLHVLLGVKSDADLLLNFMRHHDNSVSNISFPIEETVSALHGPLETIIPSYQTMLQNIQKDFLNSMNSNDATTQTDQTNVRRPSQSEYQTHNPLRISHPAILRNPAVGIGARDLDPLREGGGMLFDPFERRARIPPLGGLGVPGMLPRNAVPPGARFDPFGPPEIDLPSPHRRRPDDDHLPPPGYDDMFQ